MNYKLKYDNWIASPALLPEALSELKAIENNDKEIEYRFGAELSFGTGGIRGIIGYGTNMMNIYTVKRATFGLCKYIEGLGREAMTKGVVIAYDTRKYSLLFAKTAAGVLAAYGIDSYVFNGVAPVPVLSFAVRELKASAGIMITASHNPKEYNGYKVYGGDGAQLPPSAADQVKKYIDGVADIFNIDEVDIKNGAASLFVKRVGGGLDGLYFKKVILNLLFNKEIKKARKKVKIVYTPLHGCGNTYVTKLFKKLKVNFVTVKEQTAPDENFSTVALPNPEFFETFSMGIALAEKVKADIVLGTDPDADRVGAAVRNADGEFEQLSGNQTGVLLLDYILRRLQESEIMPENAAVVKSFVTTSLAKAVAEDYNAEVIDVPVGFKYIGEKIAEFETGGDKTFVFGLEESCGYLRGTYARDKDGIMSAALFAEMAAYYASKNKSVYGALCDIYDKYGYVYDKNISISYSGINAMNEMKAAVDKIRNTEIKNIGINFISEMRDYINGTVKLENGEVVKADLPKENAVYYLLENRSFICVRPSGTEPKLKMYFSIKGCDKAKAEESFNILSKEFLRILK